MSKTVTVDELLKPSALKTVKTTKAAISKLEKLLAQKQQLITEKEKDMYIPAVQKLVKQTEEEIKVIETALAKAKARLAELNEATGPETSPTQDDNTDPRTLIGENGPVRYDTIEGNTEFVMKTYANGTQKKVDYKVGYAEHGEKYILLGYLYGVTGEPGYISVPPDTFYDATTDRLWSVEKGWYSPSDLEA